MGVGARAGGSAHGGVVAEYREGIGIDGELGGKTDIADDCERTGIVGVAVAPLHEMIA